MHGPDAMQRTAGDSDRPVSSILLIDDSPDIRSVLRVALESAGYSVIEAADGREGVRLYREHRPAVPLVRQMSYATSPSADGGSKSLSRVRCSPAAAYVERHVSSREKR